MRVSMAVLYQAGLLSVFACACVAQTNQTVAVPQIAVRSGQFTAGAPSAWFSSGPVGGNRFQPVTGAPYSAEETTEHVQMLADGTHITQTNMQSKLYRDSEGRTRIERTILPNGQATGAMLPSFIEITDPVAGYHYMLDERNRTVRRTTWKQPVFSGLNKTNAAFLGAIPSKTAVIITPPKGAVPADASGRPHPEIARESLGIQNIEGVQATGTRTTITYPEGSFGNDRPITTTAESWTSPELKTTVLSTSSDPRYGDTTTRLTNIVRAEPDPSLFQAPDDYTVIDQPADGISFDPPAVRRQ